MVVVDSHAEDKLQKTVTLGCKNLKPFRVHELEGRPMRLAIVAGHCLRRSLFLRLPGARLEATRRP